MTGRCPTCGGRQPTWTRPVILQAMRDWADRYGAAPKRDQWERSTAEHPHYETAAQMFGGWSAALEAAGLRPRRQPWTKAQVKAAVFAFVYEHGRPPKRTEWDRACPEGTRPSATVVIHLFGSWSTAIRESGYRPLRDMTGSRARTFA